ncbi:MAG: MFS transporter [Pelotomaculum sp.]|jgi:MFS family permease
MVMKKVHPLILKLAVLAVALNEVSAGAVSPAMDAMIKAFAGQHSATTVMLIASLPSLCMLIFAPIFGKIAEIFTRRQLVLFSLIIFIIGGTAPVFLSDNLYAILGMRVLLGISVAIIMPLSLLLIDDFYSGPERDTMIGWNVAAQMVGGAIFQLLQDLGGANIYALDRAEIKDDNIAKYIQLDLGSKESIDNAVAQLPDRIDCIF